MGLAVDMLEEVVEDERWDAVEMAGYWGHGLWLDAVGACSMRDWVQLLRSSDVVLRSSDVVCRLA